MSENPVLSTEEFTSAVETLRQLIPDAELNRRQPSGPATVYTTLVTLWMMILQRLGGGQSLTATVKEVLAHNRALLPDNKRLREDTLSETSGAYADARTRLKPETVEFFANRVCNSLINSSLPWFEGRRAFLLDGTTITLPPTPELQETLCLVTTLPVSSEQAGAFYRRRYDVEHDIRDVKVSLETESIRAKSVAMVKKELLTSIVAYNLVIQFRRQAATVARLPPRRLSFKGVWDTFNSFLLTQPPCAAAEWTTRYEAALQIAARDKLPHRPGRSDPRQAHPRRPKSTKFMKNQRSKSPKTDQNPVPEKPK